MKFKTLLYGMTLGLLIWAGIIVVLSASGCALHNHDQQYVSDPNHYPYYRAVEKDHTAFVFGPDQRRNGFISQDGKMIVGLERENQFIGGGE